ncbi:SGNH/GDSL hydrolase family protein [Silvimonas sp. JCM 19000]
MTRFFPKLILSLSSICAWSAAPAQAAWTTSWTASPQRVWSAPELPLPTRIPLQLQDQTVRQTLRLSIGGHGVRVALSNRYGTQAVHFAAASLRLLPAGPALALRFAGATELTVAAGAQSWSDPLPLAVPPLAELQIDLYVATPTPLTTFHWDGKQSADLLAGDQTRAVPAPAPGAQIEARLWLAAVEVDAAPLAPGVAALGDSITDGNGVPLNANQRWPDLLAQRVRGRPVLNAGISGARLLQDGMGERASVRLQRDVLSDPSVRDIIVLLGSNDIAWPGSTFDPAAPLPTLSALQAAYLQLIQLAHAQGRRLYLGTLPPFENALAGSPIAHYASPAKDALRQQLNRWLRAGQGADGVIDFDALLRDPQHPTRLRAEYDSGDHLHPGAAGNAAMAAAVARALAATPKKPSHFPNPIGQNFAN